MVPLPGVMLDLFLATSIGMSLVVLLVALYTTDPLEFSAFPSLLLLLTLFRLALNVCSTRLILSEGHAGDVIQAFGEFVIGGNYAVGLVLFLILVVINFIVITKGAGRVAEVAARFTLDAMPGKQMAIDADLNAGLIDEKQARKRREEIAREADFYGAMDGSSKFVKGDAIAGLLITAINIVGGIFIGAFQKGLPIGQALSQYTMLTVGDGLVTQIPALIISTAAGIMVTHAAGGTRMGTVLATQLERASARDVHGRRRARRVRSRARVFRSFRSSSSAAASPHSVVSRRTLNASASSRKPRRVMQKLRRRRRRDPMSDLLQIDPIELEVGYALIPARRRKAGRRSARAHLDAAQAGARRSSAFSCRRFAFATTFACRRTNTSSSFAAPRSRAAKSCRASSSRSTRVASSATSRASTRSIRASACPRAGSRSRSASRPNRSAMSSSNRRRSLRRI